MKQKKFLKGLFKDTAHIDQPEGTWRYARNTILNEKKGSISNEGGNFASGTGSIIPPDHRAIGAIEVDDDRTIIFSRHSDVNDKRSEIGMFNRGIYTTLFNDWYIVYTAEYPGLNFQTTHPIEGTYNINSKGELIIYWTDDLNPPRAFNVTLQESFLGTATFQFRLYGIDWAADTHKNHLSFLNLFPNSGPVPHIILDEVADSHQNCIIEGGGLLTGSYYLSLAYVDDSFTATNFLTVSNPISITDEYDHIRPTTKKDGAKEKSQTAKAIKWTVGNLEKVDYTYIRPVVIRKTSDGAIDAFQLKDLKINLSAPTMDIVFSGLEGATPTSLNDVIIDTVSYETAKTINQLDGILYLGNLSGSSDLGYQKYANNIKLNSKVKLINNFDEVYLTLDNIETGFGGFPVDKYDGSIQDVDETKSYRYIPNIYKYKGYMRDEVYAFYIVFIMNDGTMSYAYHIPGRDAISNKDKADLPTTGGSGKKEYWEDIKELSPNYIKKYHFYDFSDENSGANSTLSGACRHMNYWENSTELYPNTDNFDIWDNTSGGTQIGTLQGTNVRHHHFPSNGNSLRQSIISHGFDSGEPFSEVADSEGIKFGVESWQSEPGTLNTTNPYYNSPSKEFAVFLDMASGNTASNLPVTSAGLSGDQGEWKTIVFSFGAGTMKFVEPDGFNGSSASINVVAGNPKMGDSLWKSNKYFVADQPMKVRIKWRVNYDVSGSLDDGVLVHARKVINGQDELINQGSDDGSTITINQTGSWSNWITMDIGDRIYLRARRQNINDTDVCVLENLSGNYWQRRNHIQFDVDTREDFYTSDDLKDVKLSQKINVLGFELEDIKIPVSIANKIQGFRIYRAKRGHANKRILGQSAMLPLYPNQVNMGLCEEAFGNTDANQILSVAESLKSDIWSADPWTRGYATYPKYDIYFTSTYGTGAPKYGYKTFAFHDFHLLRTKKSLAGATHIKPQYKAINFAWNAPTINQPKKMVSKIIEDDGAGAYSEPLKKIEQFWGWDTDFNCYNKEILGAIFVGCYYMSAGNAMTPGSSDVNKVDTARSAARLIGQKAKTYMPGDSILDAEALGFGGKIFNEFGESSIIFSLQDSHELYTGHLINYRGGNASSGTSTTQLSRYGEYHLNHPAILTNSPLVDTHPVDEYNDINVRRSQSWISNLHAFKTDVYKRIDNQQLVWTGFEILGDDLQNFVFSKNGDPKPYNSGNADYKTSTVQANSNSLIYEQDVQNRAIFGGDTYICRYGFRSTLKPNNTEESSEPQASIHYHIVESTDNINFRHTESHEDLYFPGSIAKEMLKAGGDKDFTFMDNLKYDNNFSVDNDIRPAFPLPIRETEQTDFPTRTHRSAKRDTTSLIDNYRIFLANDFKDIPKNRGDLWKLSSFNNLLYFHMEETLYATKGKQSMKMTDGSEAFVGSGDIFAQEPDEILQSEGGYGGTQSQWACLTTRSGYFFVDKNSRKVFMMTDKLQDISVQGLENWFKDNLQFELESINNLDACSSTLFDNPISGIGLTAVYDPKFKRILLTKKDYSLVNPTSFQTAVDLYADYGEQPTAIRYNCEEQIFQIYIGTDTGWENLEFTNASYFTAKSWTISYYPEFGLWCGFHDYTPYLYFNTSKNFYSFTNIGTATEIATIWEHNSATKGSFYGIVYPFELEFIHNEFRESDGLVFNFNYTLETFNTENISVLEHGFSSFFLYNTFQISGESNLEYLVNIRRVGNNWKVNKFRDLATLAENTGGYYMAGTLANPNIIGGVNTGTITTSSTQNMFTVDGMSEIINTNYINNTKEWQNRRKFMDKWIGIRLICDNSRNNLLNLYSTSVGVRKIYR
tara:strand:+ start:6330 stop:11804 length:5475 start_codon:yes stop_codon:yes gene_type:complete